MAPAPTVRRGDRQSKFASRRGTGRSFRVDQKVSAAGWPLRHRRHDRTEWPHAVAGSVADRARILARTSARKNIQRAVAALRGTLRKLGLFERRIRRHSRAGHLAAIGSALRFRVLRGICERDRSVHRTRIWFSFGREFAGGSAVRRSHSCARRSRDARRPHQADAHHGRDAQKAIQEFAALEKHDAGIFVRMPD